MSEKKTDKKSKPKGERLSQQEQVRRDKMNDLIAKGIDPFGQAYSRQHHSKELLDRYLSLDKETLAENPVEVNVAGRIMQKRRMGKAGFMHIQDRDGRIQIYLRQDELGQEPYDLYKKSDIGDIVGVEGTLMKTDHGDLAIRARNYTHLSKALRPLPEKFHGLVDKEERYRRRYVDLIMNEESRKIALTRPKIIRAIQSFLDSQGFVEVETPVLNTILGGAAARPFITHHNTLDIDMYLRIATELYLKRLIVGGLEGVYEIGRLFRNEGMDGLHNPEFTTVEAYQAYSDLSGMMDLVENLIRHVSKTVTGSEIITYQDQEIDFSKPFRRISMKESVKNATGIDFNEITDLEQAMALAGEKGIELEAKDHSIGHILNKFFEEFVEPTLIEPTFVYEYPIEISPLAKKSKDNPAFVDRYELFILGHEYANAFSELNDPIDQKERFEAQLALRELGDEEANEMDLDYVEALEYGMPPCGGVGLGIDRLVMLLTNQTSIREVLLFPTMRPLE